MAQVNNTVYPDVSVQTYYTTTVTLSGSNFLNYLDDGLEPSITYTMSTNEHAPFRDMHCCDMTANTPSYKYHFKSTKPQRIAISYGWPQNFGSDVCSAQQVLAHPWDVNFTVQNNLYKAFKWNAIAGRMLCIYGTNPDSNNSFTTDNWTLATWKDFKDTMAANPNTEFVLISVWVADVQGGSPTARNMPIKANPISRYSLKFWNFYENNHPSTEGPAFMYGAMRPPTTYYKTALNNVRTNASNSPDMCWPVYNYGYGVGSTSPNSFGPGRGSTSQMINGKITYGVEEGIGDTEYFIMWPGGSNTGYRTFGISSAAMGRDGLINYIEKKAACLGILICTDMKIPSSPSGGFSQNSLQKVDLTDPSLAPNMLIPITDRNGYYNGNFLVTGDNIAGTSAGDLVDGTKDTPFIDGPSTTDPTGDADIDSPDADPDISDTNTYTDSVDMTNPTLTATGVFNRTYYLNANQVSALVDYIYNPDQSVFEALIEGLFTNNPMDSLIDLRLYPFEIPSVTGIGTAENIKIGRTDTGLSGGRLSTNSQVVLDMGSCIFPRWYKNFLDFYITAQLYIPFIGVVDIPTDKCINHEISVKIIVDFVTGAATAVVFADQIPIVYKQGVIGIEIPMTGTNSQQYAKSMVGNLVGMGTSAVSAATGDLAGGIEGAIDSGMDFLENITKGAKLQTAGSSSPQCSLFQPKNCYLLLALPAVYDDAWSDIQANNVGFACYTQVNRIGSLAGTGLAVFSNVKMNGLDNATEAERKEILSLLTTGIYL